ncbi:hypothetical protein THASP1DRAFT_32803, partial [Thamnocephalis sphaerospora]
MTSGRHEGAYAGVLAAATAAIYRNTVTVSPASRLRDSRARAYSASGLALTKAAAAAPHDTHAEATRVTWPFDQTLDDQADFASRVVYALWCRERPAHLPAMAPDGQSTTELVAHVQADWAEFACGRPAPVEFRKFCHELLRITQLHPSVTLLALYYVYRLVLLNPTI